MITDSEARQAVSPDGIQKNVGHYWQYSDGTFSRGITSFSSTPVETKQRVNLLHNMIMIISSFWLPSESGSTQILMIMLFA